MSFKKRQRLSLETGPPLLSIDSSASPVTPEGVSMSSLRAKSEFAGPTPSYESIAKWAQGINEESVQDFRSRLKFLVRDYAGGCQSVVHFRPRFAAHPVFLVRSWASACMLVRFEQSGCSRPS